MKLKTVLMNLFFPPHCPFCGEIKDREGLCPQCQQSLPWVAEGVLPETGEFFQGCYAPLWYKEMARTSFHRYKFEGRKNYRRIYATLMVQTIQGEISPRPEYILWAPISRNRLRRRGYDQSRLLAEEMARQMDIPLLNGLEKWRDTKPQSSLDGESARRANCMGAYRMRDGVDVRGKNLLLVDDIITSGSTLSECSRILQMAGARSIWCVTLARGSKKRRKQP